MQAWKNICKTNILKICINQYFKNIIFKKKKNFILCYSILTQLFINFQNPQFIINIATKATKI